MSRKVGIDFGTSNSGVAVSDGRQVTVLPIDRQNVIPEVVKSILYITRDVHGRSPVYVGQEAIELYYKHNVNRLRRFVKQRAGEVEYFGGDMFYVTDVYVYVDELQPGRLLQYIKTALRSEDFEGTQIFDRYYSVVDITALYLGSLKQRAEDLLGEPLSGVTLGRPVHFARTPERDRRAEDMLRQAAEQAGFKTVEFELEPVAAALYYELSLDRPQNVLVFDFGGGTLDLTVLRLGDPQRREVYATGGVDVAGSDFDRAIIEKRLLEHFGQGQVEGEAHIRELIDAVADWMVLPDLSTPIARQRLERAIGRGVAPARLKALETLIFNDLAFSFYNAVEAAKIELSQRGAALITLQEQGIDLWELYTRAQFESDIQDYRARVEAVLLETLAAAGLEPGQIDAVVKTGGSSNIPLFNELLAQMFGPQRVKSTHAFSSVAAGLGLRAAQGRRFA
ncbi:MAG: Hsp70 family protein [Anaerolineaceae bacterium]|nr:Hsp70 family protein [Anaerolineaceae bacterium]